MRYLGLDVHTAATVWCLLDQQGKTVERGKVPTTMPDLLDLVTRLANHDELLVAQEIGTLSYFVHDVITDAGVKILSFNAQQLRVIASSRKKTDKRDAYWLAKVLQTGMMPHPVFIPRGIVRELRQLLSQREALVRDHKRWLLRARTAVRAAGHPRPRLHRTVAALFSAMLERPDGIEQPLALTLERCQRMHSAVMAELKQLQATLRHKTHNIDAIERLKTIPGVGDLVATAIYAWVGDISRFPNARCLTAYAGLVPSVRQSADTHRGGGITREGSPMLRTMLVQAGHSLLYRCSSENAAPLRAIPQRVLTTRRRRNVAVIAAARHILRIAFYVLRDGTVYDPSRLRSVEPVEPVAAAE